MADYIFDESLGRHLTEEEVSALPQPPIPSLEEAKAAKLQVLADDRYGREVAGITFAGYQVPTEKAYRDEIDKADRRAQDNPAFTWNFKVRNGLFLPANAGQIIALAQAVQAYIQALFNNEMALTVQIMSATTVEAVQAVDISVGWP